MADEVTTTTYWQGDKRVSSHSGSEAGKDAKYAEIARQKRLAAFDTAMGWSGIGGAAKKPRGADYERRFGEWEKKRDEAEAQKKAVMPKAP